MRRLLALPLAVLALLIFAAGPAAAADITVNEANDDTNGNGQCSLREAVQAANSNGAVDGCTAGDPDGDTITFSISAGSLPIILDGGELLVSDDVEVNGTTATGTRVSIDAQGNSRIFDVNVTDGAFPGDESAVAFQALVLTNGNANTNSSAPNAGGAVDVKADDDVGFTDVDVTSSVAGVNGGGIHAAGGTSLVITTTGDGSSTISGNEAQGGDAASDPVRGGGGVWSAGSTTLRGNVTVDDNTASGDVTGSGGGLLNEGGTLGIEDGVTVSNNTANRAGGGVEDNGGISTTLDGATLTGNEATGDGDAAGNGGGLHSGGGDVRVFDGTVSDNTAVEGGGLWSSGLLTVVDDGMMTVTNNTATGDAASDGGGGIYNHGGDVTVSNAEIDGNRATGTSGSGGGILNNGRPGDASLTLGAGVTVSNNAANRAGGGIEDAAANGNITSVTLNSATVSNNVAGTNPGNGGGLHSGGGNVSINGGTFGGNTAQEGGGLWTDSELSISGTTIDGNAAQGARGDDALGGGGAYVEGGGSLTITGGAQITNNTATGTAGSGGGLLSNASTLAVQNATIGSNQANRAGAGIEDAGGDVTLTDVVLDGNAIDTPAPGNGGGLHSSGGDVTIRRGAVTNNTAQEGGGLWTNGSLDVIASSDNQTEISDNAADGARTDGALGGGGVYVASGGEAVLRRALVTSNTATGTEGSGGGLFIDDSSTVDMTLGAVSSNQANRAGAGIEVGDDPGTDAATTVSLERVTVDDNSIANANPGNGGGLHSGGAGDVSVLRSTFSNNEAAEGGGLWGSGGSKLNIDLSTISGNTATSGAGGGVYLIGGGTATLTSTTVAQNTAAAGDAFSGGATPASFTLGNTIVAGDGDGDGLCAEPATYTSDGFNLVEDADCLDSPQSTDIVGQDAQLQPLADNGGPTMTHDLIASSPAGDAGSNLTGAATDQRGSGFPRTFDDGDVDNANQSDATDIGALEVSDGTIPVELAAFSAKAADGRDVVLRWKTASETGNDGFRVERRLKTASKNSSSGGGWTPVGFVESRAGKSGTSSEPVSYRKRLSGLDYGTHTFRLVQNDRDGGSEVLPKKPSVEVTLEGEAFALSAAYPNPIRSGGGRAATVELTVQEAQDVTVTLYDALGRQVRTVHDGAVEGQSTIKVRVEAGGLSSGTYLLHAEGDRFAATRKLVLVR